ncbi:MAG: FAD:protein FMN transferase [Clostridia bacterium]|nr:FAD:protein FMN transferase [Clostridia bacterium]
MKKSYTRYSIAFLLLLSMLLSCLTSCARKPKKFETTWFDYFDSFSQLTVYAERQEEFDEYAATCQSILKEYHQLLDIYYEYDGVVNLKTLNDLADKEPLAIDEKLGEFLLFGKEMHQLTGGATNIAMGSVLSLWHHARETEILPEKEALLEANEHTNIDDLKLSEDGNFVLFSDDQLKIDAGALGKGFVAEKIATELKANGCQSFLLNLGGNTVAHGTKPDGTSWLAGIENPTDGKGLEGSVELSEYALVTSGSYQRYFTVDGTKYHHIIHPKTLYPENYCLSVSVLCPDSAVADALSTALFTMTVEDGMELLKHREDTEALWLFPDGSIQTTDGFMNHVKTEN